MEKGIKFSGFCKLYVEQEYFGVVRGIQVFVEQSVFPGTKPRYAMDQGAHKEFREVVCWICDFA